MTLYRILATAQKLLVPKDMRSEIHPYYHRMRHAFSKSWDCAPSQRPQTEQVDSQPLLFSIRCFFAGLRTQSSHLKTLHTNNRPTNFARLTDQSVTHLKKKLLQLQREPFQHDVEILVNLHNIQNSKLQARASGLGDSRYSNMVQDCRDGYPGIHSHALSTHAHSLNQQSNLPAPLSHCNHKAAVDFSPISQSLSYFSKRFD